MNGSCSVQYLPKFLTLSNNKVSKRIKNGLLNAKDIKLNYYFTYKKIISKTIKRPLFTYKTLVNKPPYRLGEQIILICISDIILQIFYYKVNPATKKQNIENVNSTSTNKTSNIQNSLCD